MPATVKPADQPLPVVAFNAHVDTSPETTGKNVKPHVIRNYDGGDIPLAGDPTKVIRVADNPELAQLVGKTIITTDGTTLLGADDKAGVAVIMELAHTLVEHPQIPHGPVRICFTCDEEIGHGVDHVDLTKLGATVGYTLDGGGAGEIDAETFSADLATVTVRGVNIHPSIGKGRMVNAVRAAAAVPRPAAASGRCRPRRPTAARASCTRTRSKGGVAEVTIKILLRDFDTAELADKAELLRKAAREVEAEIPGCADRRADRQAVPQHGRRPGQGAAGGGLRRGGASRGWAASRS